MANDITFYAKSPINKVINGVYYSILDVFTFADRTHTVTSDAPGGGDGVISPWTIDEARAQVLPGMIVGISAGTYLPTYDNPFSETWNKVIPAFYPHTGGGNTDNGNNAISGTSEEPIYFIAENFAALNSSNLSTILSGGAVQGQGRPAFGLWHNDHVHYIGLHTSEANANSKSYTDSAPVTNFGGTDYSIRYCKIIGVEGDGDNHSGYRTGTGTYNGLISDNVISGFILGAGSSVNQSGIITYYCNNTIFEYNDISGCGSAFQHKGHDLYNLTHRYNLVYNNPLALRFHGMEEYSGIRSSIYQNLFFDNSQQVEFSSAGGIDYTNSNVDIINNTFYSSGTSDRQFYITDYDASIFGSGNTLKNNIISLSGASSIFERFELTPQAFVGYLRPDYNCYHGATNHASIAGSSHTLASWLSNTDSDDNSIQSDPLLETLTESGLTLGVGSPALNSCLDILNIKGLGTSEVINMGARVTGSEVFGPRSLS